MFKIYINIALRTLKRQKAYALINVIGLSTGIMACLLILLFVRDADSYETFYPESDLIYRLSTVYETQDQKAGLAILPARVVELAYAKIPEAKHLTLLNGITQPNEILVQRGEDKIVERNFYYADSAYFQVFQHEFIQGDPKTALFDPNSVVLTETGARKYFNSIDVLNKSLNLDGSDRLITGVIKDMPGKTILAFDMLLPTSRNRAINTEGWYPMNYPVFGKFTNELAAEGFISKLNQLVDDEMGEEFEAQGFRMGFGIEPITGIHFNTSIDYDFGTKLPRNLMYSLIAVSFFILVIACINYINLSTAKSEKRAKEVGIRKVMGAGRSQLVWQFYGETFVITLVSVVMGVVLTEVVLTPFNQMINADLSLNLLSDPTVLIGLLLITVLVSVLAGSYPASFLSSFKPTRVLKGALSNKGGNAFRRVLVTLQFVVSVFLIVGTITISKQLNFIQNKEIGFQQEELVYFNMSDRTIRGAYETFKGQYAQIPGVKGITGSNNLISNVVSGYGAIMEGLPKNVNISFKGQNGDEAFLETMGFELVAGEGFANKSDLDSSVYYMLNETGVDALGITPEEAIGKRFGIGESKMGTIVGVVKDFHMISIHNAIEPWAVYTGPDKYMSYMVARVDMSRLEDVKAQMSSIWESRITTYPFEMNFVDESVREAYEKDQQLGKLIISFTVLALIIGCLGLFGLASYLAEKRTKEIGIRKVLGADVSRIVMLLSKEYIRIIIMANLIAWPLAYYFMNNWLDSFAYRINVNWMVFLLAAVITVCVAGLTVSYQSIKAAISNPVNALRNE